MALLNLTPPEKAEGKLAELYAGAEAFFGAVPNNVRMLGVSPAVLENQMHFAEYAFSHPTLKPPFFAMIRLLVSKACNSPYCETVNKHLLKQGGLSEQQVEAIMDNPANAPLDDKEKELLKFVLKVCDDPHSSTQTDIEQLKGLGWSEQDIFDAVAHGARAVATNIIFDAFKLDSDF